MSYAEIDVSVVLDSVDAVIKYSKGLIKELDDERREFIDKKAAEIINKPRLFSKSYTWARNKAKGEHDGLCGGHYFTPPHVKQRRYASLNTLRAKEIENLALASKSKSIFISVDDSAFLSMSGTRSIAPNPAQDKQP